MSRDRAVRRPQSESADPFGDFPVFDTADRTKAGTEQISRDDEPAAPSWADVQAASYQPAPPPSSDNYLPPEGYVPEGFEPEPASGGGGSWIGGLLAAGLVRLVGAGIAIAIGTAGFGLFQANVGDDGPPNVPGHVLDACYQALNDANPAGVSYGSHYAYEQSGGDSLVRFRATDRSEFTCRWDDFTWTASIEDVIPAST